MMEENLRDEHNLLLETLWAYRNSKRAIIGLSPFLLTYRHDTVLPMEVLVPSLRVTVQKNLVLEDYS